MVNKNIFNIIKDNASEKFDDFIIYEGYIINKKFLVASGYENDYLKKNDSLYPIYIPGKHPLLTASGEDVNLSHIYDNTSYFYRTGNYYEICAKDADDTSSPNPGDFVRIYYNKSKNKTYAIGYFKVVKKDALASTLNNGTVNQSDSSLDTSNNSVTNSFNKVNYPNITLTFDTLFNSLIGNILIYKYNKLTINLYAIAYRESNINPYAIDQIDTNHGSKGLYQLNRNYWNDSALQNFINMGFNVINTNNKLTNTYTVSQFDSSLDSTKGINNLDTQTLAYIGFLYSNNVLSLLTGASIQDKTAFNTFATVQRFTGYNDINSAGYQQYYGDSSLYTHGVYEGYSNGLIEYTNYYNKLKGVIEPSIIAKTTTGLDNKYKQLVNYLS